MSEWKECNLDQVSLVNPTESLKKGTSAKKIAMEKLSPFKKKAEGFSIELYNGGSKFRNGDTVVARITPCLENGKTAYIDILEDNEVGFGSTEFIVIRELPDISDKQFLYYFCISDEFRDVSILAMNGSSGRQRVELEVVKKHKFLLPPLAEQKAIAGVLSALDDKIDLLHRQNKTLEAMAEALFRQWFVEEAEESWEEGKLGDEFIITMGQSPPGESYNEEGLGIPMYQGNADFEFRFPKNRVFTTDPKRFAEKFDTLISVRAPVGAQNMANERCCIGRGVASLRYKFESELYCYTYYKIRYHMLEIAGYNDTGTVFGSIGKDDLWGIKTFIPTKSEAKEFDSNLKPLNDRIMENCFQIRSLEKLRDTLLPKLMSGEVRVEV